MSDYDHTRENRNFPQSSIDGGGGTGTGLFWVLVVIAILGLLVLIGFFGGGSTTVEHPGGAGSETVIAPSEGEGGTAATGGATETTGTGTKLVE